MHKRMIRLGNAFFLAALFILLLTVSCCFAREVARPGLRIGIDAHVGEVTAVSISSDSTLVASAGQDGRVRVWDIISGRGLHVIGKKGEVTDVAFSPDDTRILCAVRDGSDKYVLQIWDYRRQELLKTIEGDGQRINSIAYSPDGKFIAAGARGGEVWIRMAENGNIVRKFQVAGSDVRAVGWSPDGASVAGGMSLAADVILWDTATDRVGKALKGHSDWVNAVMYTPDGHRIISGSNDGSIRIWDTASGTEKSIIREWWWGEINDLAINGAANYLAAATGKAGVVLWSADDGTLLDVLDDQTGKVNSVTIAADGKSIVAGGSDGKVKIWETPGNGPLESVFALAVAHDNGSGKLKENKTEAYRWYLRAADRGYPAAMVRLGAMLAAGEGVGQDLEAALMWLQKAAALGHGEALYVLGNMYAVGRGVKLDHDKSIELWRSAAESGHAAAKKKLAIKSGEISIALIDKDSLELVKKTAADGDIAAQYSLGLIYSTGGHGIARNSTKAVKWFKKAARQGHAEAQFHVAKSYETGEGSPQLPREALEWSRKAAEQGHVEAQYYTGLYYANGDGGERDDKEAASWLKKASAQGDIRASCRLGIFFCSGRGVAQNYARAIELWEKASAKGDDMATFFLAYMYETGSGLKLDHNQARKLYTIAAGKGNIFAGQAIGSWNKSNR